jgi:hypothetical protein
MRGMTEHQALKQIVEMSDIEFHRCFNGVGHNFVVTKTVEHATLGLMPEIVAVYKAYKTPKGNILYTAPKHKA